MNFYQCLLCKYEGDDTFFTVAWIPEKFASLDFRDKRKVIKLKEDDGTWSNGWHIKYVYNARPEEFVFAHERDFVRQRDASDI
jgi:hypothetical protein